MKKKLTLLSICVIFLSLIVRLRFNFPITYQEAKESYTAFSILKTFHDTNGNLPFLLFRSDNNFLSPAAVYLRLPFIALFGLTNVATRLPVIFVGLVSIYIFYQALKKLLNNTTHALVGTVLFSISPLLIQTNIFNLESTLALLMLCLAYLALEYRKVKFFFLLSILTLLCSSTSSIFVLGLQLLAVRKKIIAPWLGFASAATIAILCIVGLLIPTTRNYLLRATILGDVNQQSYIPTIDLRLSFDTFYPTPLMTKQFNFHRLGINKPFFAINQIAKGVIRPFNYEKLTSAWQAGPVMAKEISNQPILPKLYFWEIPVLAFGLMALLKKHILLARFGFLTGLTVIVFPVIGLPLAAPFVAILEVFFLFITIPKLKDKAKLALVIFGTVTIFSFMSFVDLLWFHQPLWMADRDFRMEQIFSVLSKQDLENNAIFLTDRLGEPVYYYLYYKQIDPSYFQSHKHIDKITDQGVERIDQVGSVKFGSFSYDYTQHGPHQIWIGLVGEFIGPNKLYKGQTVTVLGDGEVYKKIVGLNKVANLNPSDELWFSKTNLAE